jgi:hypothetical protein
MGMTLGDAFNRRKKLDADIQSWINRLTQAARDHREYVTKNLEGPDAYKPEPGTEKIVPRHYTIEECQRKLQELISEDQQLALRISLTNQKARATLQCLDGTLREMSVPELIVLKTDIILKMEKAARAVPTRVESMGVFEEGPTYVKQRSVTKIEKKKETLLEKGLKLEETVVTGYRIEENTEYGILQRQAWDEIDRIQEFAQRVKQAINEANKTELIDMK